MRVAIYYPWIYLTSGIERTILETVKKSKHEITIFTNHLDRKNTFPEFKNFKIIELRKIPVRRNLWDVLRAAVTITFQKINLTEFELLLVHSEGLGDLILFRNNEIPSICFCHTPLRPVFDTEYKKRIYKKKNNVQKLLYHFFAYFFRLTDSYLWKKYKYIFFNSHETLRRAKKGRLLKNLEGRYEVLYPGVNTKKIKLSSVYKPYFLLPGRIMWTKNIELGIKSFIKFKEKYKDLDEFKLIIAGQVDEKSKSYLYFLKNNSKKRDDIKFVISPSDKILNKMYSECWAVLFTSFNEDWGLAILEGNAFGKPAIAIRRGGVKESQVDGKTGFLVQDNIDAFSEAMSVLARSRSLTKKLGKFARNYIKKYDISHFIKRLDTILDIINKNNI